jgi:rRNA maturation endonuclease Nob1
MPFIVEYPRLSLSTMVSLESIKNLVSGDDTDKMYSYQCASCKTEFSSPIDNPNDAVCPDCSSDDVLSAM